MEFCKFTLPSKKNPILPRNFTRQFFNSSEPTALIIKLITAVIYGFLFKLECLSLNTRLGWKGLPGRKTLAYYINHKLQL